MVAAAAAAAAAALSGGSRRGGDGRRHGGGCRGRGGKDFGSVAARKKKNQDFYEKLRKRTNCQKTSNKSIKTSILEELRKNGRRHQILREKLPLQTYFQIRTIENC